jgi:Domain of unknown function (DUF4440)
VHDVNIRILSDVALIHGRSTYTMLSDGVDQEALYTDTYQKREGTWSVSPHVRSLRAPNHACEAAGRDAATSRGRWPRSGIHRATNKTRGVDAGVAASSGLR